MPTSTPLTLPTPRLLLRPLRPSDAPAIYAMHADPAALRYWSTPPWSDPQQAVDLITSDQQAMAEGDYLRLGLETQADRRLIGLCTLFAFHLPSRRCEIGYILRRDLWGQGYMHEALSTLLDYGFAVLGLNRVEADIDPRNTASQRSLARLGFVHEGRLRERWIVAGERSDSDLYGLLRSDWPPQAGDGKATGGGPRLQRG